MKPTRHPFLLSLFILPCSLFSQPTPETLGSPDQLLLYALAESPALTANNLLSTNGSSTHLPLTALTNGNLTLTFTPRRYELAYTVQYSTDLQTWADIPTPIAQLHTPHTIASPLPTSTAEKQFLRLKITLDPLTLDTDADHLPDHWELHHFGTLTASNATSDHNNDGITDLSALIYNIDPKLPLSSQSSSVTTYQYTPRAQLTAYTTPSSTHTLALDPESNLQSTSSQ